MRGYEIERDKFGVRPGGTFVTQRMIDEHGGYKPAREYVREQYETQKRDRRRVSTDGSDGAQILRLRG